MEYPLNEFERQVLNILLSQLKRLGPQNPPFELSENSIVRLLLQEGLIKYSERKKGTDITIRLKNFLIENGLINEETAYTVRLTIPKGRDLLNGTIEDYFDNEKKQDDANLIIKKGIIEDKLKADELRDTSIENAYVNIQVSKWLLKTKWWPLFISAVATFGALVSAYYARRAYSLSEQTAKTSVTIEEIQKQLQETKNATLHYTDNVYQKMHSADTTKK